MRRIAPARPLLAAAFALVLAATMAACAAEDADPAGTASVTASATASASASASPSAPATADPDAIALPGSCESIYSAGMLQTLQTQTPPLNDPAVTVTSTKLVDALEVLQAVSSLRCTWGSAGQSGIATTVAIVDAGQSATVLSALQSNGFGCSETAGGTLCTASSDSVDIDTGDVVQQGESHFLRGNAWIATTWITVDPAGYTEDIAATLWG